MIISDINGSIPVAMKYLYWALVVPSAPARLRLHPLIDESGRKLIRFGVRGYPYKSLSIAFMIMMIATLSLVSSQPI